MMSIPEQEPHTGESSATVHAHRSALCVSGNTPKTPCRKGDEPWMLQRQFGLGTACRSMIAARIMKTGENYTLETAKTSPLSKGITVATTVGCAVSATYDVAWRSTCMLRDIRSILYDGLSLSMQYQSNLSGRGRRKRQTRETVLYFDPEGNRERETTSREGPH